MSWHFALEIWRYLVGTLTHLSLESLSPPCRGKVAAQNCRLTIMSLKPLPCKTQHFLGQERAGKSQLTDCCAAGAYNLMALRYSGGSQTLQEDPIQGLGFRTFAEACYVRTIVMLSGRCSSSQKYYLYTR